MSCSLQSRPQPNPMTLDGYYPPSRLVSNSIKPIFCQLPASVSTLHNWPGSLRSLLSLRESTGASTHHQWPLPEPMSPYISWNSWSCTDTASHLSPRWPGRHAADDQVKDIVWPSQVRSGWAWLQIWPSEGGSQASGWASGSQSHITPHITLFRAQYSTGTTRHNQCQNH